ncbi:hypothetical protein GCM10011273_34640 [Asticcacaulis endophyticus]|uniref:Uncharacterized protein n=1 Tax=Asticcacaulis endophyticus TaxID=1395890 RepID=A0A918UZD5_9CAUL|nr:hypothetical protein GCM10011273_34640 [Asticcacaulis endophyticus]
MIVFDSAINWYRKRVFEEKFRETSSTVSTFLDFKWGKQGCDFRFHAYSLQLHPTRFYFSYGRKSDTGGDDGQDDFEISCLKKRQNYQ